MGINTGAFDNVHAYRVENAKRRLVNRMDCVPNPREWPDLERMETRLKPGSRITVRFASSACLIS